MGARNGYYREVDYGMIYRVENGFVTYVEFEPSGIVLVSAVAASGVTEENGFTFMCDLEGNRG